MKTFYLILLKICVTSVLAQYDSVAGTEANQTLELEVIPSEAHYHPPVSEEFSGENNHSEAIQKILRDFEKSLKENKKSPVTEEASETNPQDLNDVLEEKSTVTHEESNDTSEAVPPSASKLRLVCSNPDLEIDEVLSPSPSVLLLNGSAYQAALHQEYSNNVTNRSSPGLCSVTLFYAGWCEFSVAAAPHYNALSRVFPQLPLYAVDASLHHSLLSVHGVMATPTIIVFHNSRPAYKYNYTVYNLQGFTEFISLVTGLEPQNVTEPSPDDWLGPVPSTLVPSPPYLLLVAFLFTVCCVTRHLSTSQPVLHLLDTVRNAWREAEIQHEHEE